MSTYTIKLSSGNELTLFGDGIEVDSDAGVVLLHSGNEAYNFLRESILYWTVTNELTERQLRILKSMAAGKTNGGIGRELGYSESTVRQETMAIYKSLAASGRDEAVSIAIEHGLLDDGPLGAGSSA